MQHRRILRLYYFASRHSRLDYISRFAHKRIVAGFTMYYRSSSTASTTMEDHDLAAYTSLFIFTWYLGVRSFQLSLSKTIRSAILAHLLFITIFSGLGVSELCHEFQRVLQQTSSALYWPHLDILSPFGLLMVGYKMLDSHAPAGCYNKQYNCISLLVSATTFPYVQPADP